MTSRRRFLTAFLLYAGCDKALGAVRNEHRAQLQSWQYVAKPLEEVLAALESSGRSAISQTDAVERVCVFAEGLSPEAVRAALAILLNREWRSEPDGTRRLVQTGDQRAFETRTYRHFLEELAAPLKGFLRDARRPSPPADTDATKTSPQSDAKINDWLFATPYGKAGISFLDALTPETLRTLMDTGRMRLAWASLTPAQQTLARAARTGLKRYDKKGLFLLELDAAAQDEARDLAGLQEQGMEVWTRAEPVTGAMQMVFAGRGQTGAIVRFPQSKAALRLRGTPYEARDAAPTGAPATCPEEWNRVPFPTNLPLKAEMDWATVLAVLAPALPLPVISDAFTAARGLLDIAPQLSDSLNAVMLPDGLDRLCAAFNQQWWVENNVLFFRSQTWLWERQYETAPALLRQVSRQIEADGRLNAAALTTLSTLTRRQLQGLVGYAHHLKSVRVIVNGESAPLDLLLSDSKDKAEQFYRYLRLFSLLDAGQQEAALSPPGLPITALTSSQKYALSQFPDEESRTAKVGQTLRIATGQPRRASDPAEMWVAWAYFHGLNPELVGLYVPFEPLPSLRASRNTVLPKP